MEFCYRSHSVSCIFFQETLYFLDPFLLLCVLISLIWYSFSKIFTESKLCARNYCWLEDIVTTSANITFALLEPTFYWEAIDYKQVST